MKRTTTRILDIGLRKKNDLENIYVKSEVVAKTIFGLEKRLNAHLFMRISSSSQIMASYFCISRKKKQNNGQKSPTIDSTSTLTSPYTYTPSHIWPNRTC